MLISIVAAVIVLGLLVLFHELGHFFVATRVGVGVTKFSIGFGPVVFGRRVGRTEYAISAIPLGGFVKMVGEDPEEELTEADRAIAFQTQPLWKRAAIVMAGPLSNLVFAFIAFSLVGAIYGTRVPSELAKVGAVIPKMPAAAAGLEAGDVILAVGATPVEKWDKLSETIRASGGKPVELTIQRGDTRVQVTLTPEARPDKNIFGETLGTAYVIGIERGFDQEDVGIGTAIVTGAEQTVWWVQTLLMSIVKIGAGPHPDRGNRRPHPDRASGWRAGAHGVRVSVAFHGGDQHQPGRLESPANSRARWRPPPVLGARGGDASSARHSAP